MAKMTDQEAFRRFQYLPRSEKQRLAESVRRAGRVGKATGAVAGGVGGAGVSVPLIQQAMKLKSRPLRYAALAAASAPTGIGAITGSRAGKRVGEKVRFKGGIKKIAPFQDEAIKQRWQQMQQQRLERYQQYQAYMERRRQLAEQMASKFRDQAGLKKTAEEHTHEAEMRGRAVAQAMWSELELMNSVLVKVAFGSALRKTAEAFEHSTPQESPVQGVVGSQVELQGDRKARGIPIIQPPPGFIYNPELAAFVPDQADPGWMEAAQAQQAANNKTYYDMGAQETQQQQAQAEMDQQAQAQIDQQQQAVAEQQAAMQQQGAQQPQQQGAQQAGAPQIATPAGIAGGVTPPGAPAVEDPAASKPNAKTPKGQSITVKVGK